MAGDDIARIMYLTILGGALLAYVLLARRADIGQSLRHLMLWGLIFIGVAAGYGLWEDTFAPRTQAVVSGDGQIAIPRARDGHYYLTLEVNDTAVRFVVDTGATDLVLSQRDAAAAGLDPDTLAYLGQARTANGVVAIARVTLDQVVLAEGDLRIEDRRVPAFVNQGELDTSLLGMGYLERFARIEIADGRLILTR
ncbi:MAG: TIGR02281 family clan AA aspartic protease [Rhodobacteraceae bacterium]|nr:TIGR02281 family clan AA aspartic protease [Paracoccaceae bacterium]